MTERLTFSKSGNNNCNKSRHEKDANTVQDKFVAGTPQVDRDPLEEFGNGPFAHPDEQGVEDAGSQNQFRAQFTVPDFLSSVVDAVGGDVVGAVDQNYVHTSHARKKRDQSEEHDPIFPEQLVAPGLPAAQAREDDDGSKTCCPPAVEKCRVVCEASPAVGWSAGPNGARLEDGGHVYASLEALRKLRPEAELRELRFSGECGMSCWR